MYRALFAILSTAPLWAAASPAIPLVFEASPAAQAGYWGHAPGIGLWLGDSNATLAVQQGKQRAALEIGFSGANRHPSLEAEQPLRSRTNYFAGNDPSQWRTGVANYASVRYRQIYPGIDLVFHGNTSNGNPRQLEYDWVLSPGANPRSIRMNFRGAASARLNDSGDLVLNDGGFEIVQHAPRVIQEGRAIEGRFVRRGKNSFGIALGPYDKTKPVTIDPVLSYSTFVGGTGGDIAYSVAVDPTGKLLVGGATLSSDFPLKSPVMNMKQHQTDTAGFIVKIDPTQTGAASLLWSTYVSANQVADDYAAVLAVAADAQGNVLATGLYATVAGNSGFPLVNAFQSFYTTGLCGNSPLDFEGDGDCENAFVLKLDPTGQNIIYASFLGGSQTQTGYAIAADPNGNAYVAGQTDSPDFPRKGGAYQTSLYGASDGFLAEVSPVGKLLYSSYLGGEQNDVITSVAIDSKGMVDVAGYTTSATFPIQNGFQTVRLGPQDAFVAQMNLSVAGAGQLVYSTYLGGTMGSSAIEALTVDSQQNIYVAGGTSAADFPVTAQTAFQSKLNLVAPGLTLNIPGYAVNSYIGDAFVAEISPSAAAPNNPTQPTVPMEPFSGRNLHQPTAPHARMIRPALATRGWHFVLAMASSSTGSSGSPPGSNPAPSGNQLLYSTFLGGSGADIAMGIALDAKGHIYVAGTTDSGDFPTTPDALLGTNGGATAKPTQKAFLTSLDPTQPGSKALLYSTYFGGSGNDAGLRVALDTGGVDLVGQTASANLPLKGAYQASSNGPSSAADIAGDAFIARLDLTKSGPVITSASNGASFHPNAGFAPGEVVTFKGQGLGPNPIQLAQLDSNGRLAATLAGCQLNVDGTPAPLVHALATQITGILPYELQDRVGQQVQAQVTCNGLPSNVWPFQVVAADPGIFSDGPGTGPAAMLNQDGSYNSVGNPAAKGSVVTLFATGEGQLNPAGGDGRIETGPLSSIPVPKLPVTVMFGGVAATKLTYVGVAPNEVDGLLQIDAQIPAGAPSGSAVPLSIQVGSTPSQPGLTMSIQ